jgi:hypothetical protein
LRQGITRTPILKDGEGTSVAMDDKKKKKTKKEKQLWAFNQAPGSTA